MVRQPRGRCRTRVRSSFPSGLWPSGGGTPDRVGNLRRPRSLAKGIGKSLILQSHEGKSTLHYDHLKVWDAAGTYLAAELRVEESRVIFLWMMQVRHIPSRSTRSSPRITT